jgi:outer membrane receptor protein involved in Fe transport
MRSKLLFTTALLASTTPIASPAFAQAAPAAETGTTGGDSVIVVTARKREERAIEVPIALNAVSGEALEERGARNLVDFLQEAPGVGIYDQGTGTAKITIRGISTSLGANENGYYLDDLPFTGVTVPINPDVRAWDLDRVEILRGPQGTLFGEGSLGGTIRVLTKGADLDEWEAKASGFVSGTDDGGTNSGIKGALNAPIVPGMLAVRLAGTHERFDGWIDNAAAGTSNLNSQSFDTFRAKARFDPTDRLSLTGSYWLFNSNFAGGGSAATDDGEQSQSSALAAKVRYRLYGATARYDLGEAELFYGFSHNKFSLPQTGSLFGGTVDLGIGIKVDAHELRLASTGDGPLQWTVGGYSRKATRSDDVVFALFGIDNIDYTRSRANAVFGEGTYSFGKFDLTAGLRYYDEKLGGFETNSGVVTPDEGDTYKSLNPRFSLAWHPNDRATIYASAAKGFRAGQLQPTTSIILGQQFGIDLPAALGQDSIWTYELGAKADFAGRLATVEGAVFFSKWKDVTVRIPIATTGFNGLINSNGTVTKGAEFSLVLRPTRGLTLNASGAYVDATFDGAVAGTGITDGSPVDEVSKFTANASIDYRTDISSTVTGSARIGWQHNSSRSFESFPGYLPGDRIDRVDARVGIEFDFLTVALFAENLTNENGATSFRTVQPIAPGIDDITASRLRPRTIGIEANIKFGGRER